MLKVVRSLLCPLFGLLKKHHQHFYWSFISHKNVFNGLKAIQMSYQLVPPLVSKQLRKFIAFLLYLHNAENFLDQFL